MNIYPPFPRKVGRPRGPPRKVSPVRIDEELFDYMKREHPGKMSDLINSALRFYLEKKEDFESLVAEKEILDRHFAVCLKCAKDGRVAWPLSSGLMKCPECGGRMVIIEEKEEKEE